MVVPCLRARTGRHLAVVAAARRWPSRRARVSAEAACSRARALRSSSSSARRTSCRRRRRQQEAKAKLERHAAAARRSPARRRARRSASSRATGARCAGSSSRRAGATAARTRLKALGPLSMTATRALLASRRTRRCGGGVRPSKLEEPRTRILPERRERHAAARRAARAAVRRRAGRRAHVDQARAAEDGHARRARVAGDPGRRQDAGRARGRNAQGRRDPDDFVHDRRGRRVPGPARPGRRTAPGPGSRERAASTHGAVRDRRGRIPAAAASGPPSRPTAGSWVPRAISGWATCDTRRAVRAAPEAADGFSTRST